MVCKSGSPTARCPLKSRPATQKLNCLTLFIFLHASQIFSPFYHHGPKQSWWRSCHGSSQLSHSSQARCTLEPAKSVVVAKKCHVNVRFGSSITLQSWLPYLADNNVDLDLWDCPSVTSVDKTLLDPIFGSRLTWTLIWGKENEGPCSLGNNMITVWGPCRYHREQLLYQSILHGWSLLLEKGFLCPGSGIM